jgi:hypothetical protein
MGTYSKVNPSVRLYNMHAQYHVPIDYKVYEFNIEDANKGNPGFKVVTSMK